MLAKAAALGKGELQSETENITMSKPAAWRSESAAYPYAFTVQTRFQDLDTLGHINNVAMAALFETGRVGFNHSMESRNLRAKGERWLIARVDISYVAEGHFPDDVVVMTGVGDIGRSSWSLLSAAFQNGKCIATCDCTLVWTDANGGRPLPDEFRAELERNRVTMP